MFSQEVQHFFYLVIDVVKRLLLSLNFLFPSREHDEMPSEIVHSVFERSAIGFLVVNDIIFSSHVIANLLYTCEQKCVVVLAHKRVRLMSLFYFWFQFLKLLPSNQFL